MASFSVCREEPRPTIYRRNLRREKNDRLVSVHTSIDYGCAEACSGKEIAGLLKKKMMTMKNNYDDPKNREIACERILAWQTGGR